MKKYLYPIIILFLVGCASYPSLLKDAKQAMARGDSAQAALSLKTLADKPGRSQLAYLLEYAITLHESKNYKESNKVLAEAEQHAEMNDYTSLSKEVGALLLNEGMVQFKVEPHELILITVYRALNYFFLDDYENAHVMARKIVEKLNALDVKREFKKSQLGFAYYLSGLIYDVMGDYDNALVLYEKSLGKLSLGLSSSQGIANVAILAQRSDKYNRIKSKLNSGVRKKSYSELRKNSELIVIFQQGWAPRKVPNTLYPGVPNLVSTYSDYNNLKVTLDGESTLSTEMIFDVDKAATKMFQARIAGYIVKYAARVALRKSLSKSMNKKNQGLGSLVELAMDLGDRADLRQWSLLPASFQIVRLQVKPGKHKLKLVAHGPKTSELVLQELEIDLKKGQKKVISTRAF